MKRFRVRSQASWVPEFIEADRVHFSGEFVVFLNGDPFEPVIVTALNAIAVLEVKEMQDETSSPQPG